MADPAEEARGFRREPPRRLADERRRIVFGLLEQVADPITLRRLERLGVREGWRCLEVGAGHGSVARWLARQVGPQGEVVATDRDTRFLRDLAGPNIEVRHHDILNDALEDGHYDLVHCRFLLMHLPQPQRRALACMAGAVRLCLVPAADGPANEFRRAFILRGGEPANRRERRRTRAPVLIAARCRESHETRRPTRAIRPRCPAPRIAVRRRWLGHEGLPPSFRKAPGRLSSSYVTARFTASAT